MIKVFKDVKTKNKFLISSSIITTILTIGVNKYISFLFILCALLDAKDIEIEQLMDSSEEIEKPSNPKIIECKEVKNVVECSDLGTEEKIKIHVSEDRSLRNKRNFKDFEFKAERSYLYTPSGFECSSLSIPIEEVQDRNKITILTEIRNTIDACREPNYLSELRDNLDSFDKLLTEYYHNMLDELDTFNNYIQCRVDYYSKLLDDIRRVFSYANLEKDLHKIFNTKESSVNLRLEHDGGVFYCGLIYITREGIFAIGDTCKLRDLLGADIIDIENIDIDTLRNLKPKYSVLEVKQFNAVIATHIHINEFYSFRDFRKEVKSNLELFKKEKEQNIKRIRIYLDKLDRRYEDEN